MEAIGVKKIDVFQVQPPQKPSNHQKHLITEKTHQQNRPAQNKQRNLTNTHMYNLSKSQRNGKLQRNHAPKQINNQLARNNAQKQKKNPSLEIRKTTPKKWKTKHSSKYVFKKCHPPTQKKCHKFTKYDSV